MSKYPIFRHYLEDEDDKPYYTMNSLSFYYEDMERKQKLIESLAKSIAGYDIRLTDNLEAIEKEVDRRLADWDKQLERFPDSVEGLLSKWSTDGTIDTVIQTALIDEKIEPLTVKLAETDYNANIQTDFVKLLQESNEVADKLFVKVTGVRSFDVMIPIKGNKVAHYGFKKDNNDDFIKMGDIKVSRLEKIASTAAMNYDITTGGFNTNGAPNYYANPNSVGATFSLTFTGTGFDFQHRADANGGVWEFVVDGNTENAVRISTHINASPSSFSTRQVFRNLENVEHTLVATFIGDDPNNLPSGGVGTSRGWLSYNTGSDPGRETIIVHGFFMNAVPSFTVNTGSNKEFAFSHGISENNGSTWGSTYWIPEHNGIGTAFLGEQRVFFGENEITNWAATGELIEVKSVKIIQGLNAIHPESPSEPSAKITSVTSVSAKGVSVQAKFTALRPLFIEGGHVLMLVADNTFADELITSFGKRYDATRTDETRDDLTENDKAISYAFINNSGTNEERDTVLAVTHNSLARTLRWGKENRKPDGVLWLQHRASLQKLYPHVMRSHTMETGEEYELSGVYFLGEIPMASEILPNE